MKTFNDNSGRTWSVSLNVTAIKNTRTLAGVDLMEAVGGKLLERLTTDPVLLCDILYAVCKAECDARNVTDEDFGRALAGDAIDAATTALLEELVDFFPQAKRRVLGKAMGKLKVLQARALEVAELRLDSPELDEAMAECLGTHYREKMKTLLRKDTPAKEPGSTIEVIGSGLSSGSWPVSPESIPAP